jgi:hypothetical protein
MRVSIRGRYYTLRFGRPITGAVGHFDPDAKEIVISPRLKGEHKADCIVHEILHAALPDLDEEAVNQTASDIARVLWRLGYRSNEST